MVFRKLLKNSEELGAYSIQLIDDRKTQYYIHWKENKDFFLRNYK